MTEIACDESGHEGERLVGGETDVFAHASVRMSTASAADLVAELRDRIRSPAQEYKANHLLRQKHRPVLDWFLGPASPIHGHASVLLVDKAFFLLSRAVADPGAAHTLYRDGRGIADAQRWTRFLTAANELFRARAGADTVAPFVDAVDTLRDGMAGAVAEVLGSLRSARPSSVRPPVLDLLGPAIVRAVQRWSADQPVAVVHHRHVTLTYARIAQIRATPGLRLSGVRLVGSRDDPRVQVADFLAGIARKAASYELAGRGDPALVGLLRSHVDPCSVWGDDRSWSQLRPGRMGP